MCSGCREKKKRKIYDDPKKKIIFLFSAAWKWCAVVVALVRTSPPLPPCYLAQNFLEKILFFFGCNQEKKNRKNYVAGYRRVIHWSKSLWDGWNNGPPGCPTPFCLLLILHGQRKKSTALFNSCQGRASNGSPQQQQRIPVDLKSDLNTPHHHLSVRLTFIIYKEGGKRERKIFFFCFLSSESDQSVAIGSLRERRRSNPAPDFFLAPPSPFAAVGHSAAAATQVDTLSLFPAVCHGLALRLDGLFRLGLFKKIK